MKKVLLLLTFGLFCFGASAQQWGPEWGATEEEKAEHRRMLNFMRDHNNRSEWGMVAHYLHHLMKEVPAAHPRLYQMGIDMYKRRVESETDPAKKLVLADSLILLHDKYLDNFAEKYAAQAPTMWNNRAAYVQKYYGEDKAKVAEAFRLASEKAGAEMPSLYVNYFNELTAAYIRQELPADEYLTAYDKLAGQIAAVEGAEDQQKQLEKLFVDSGAASCENIEKIKAAEIAANPDDAALLNRTIAMLNNANCKGEFYMSVAEKLYKLEPTAMNARIIAASYKAKGDNATAARLLQEALAMVTEPAEKVELLLGMATDELLDKNFRAMYGNAQQAASIDPKNAMAQYYVALATAGGATGCSGMGQRAAYWLAYDRMQEARRAAAADPATKPEFMNDIESNIARFASAFPTAEELFLEGLGEGSAYTVNCGWVSGRTTVRRRP